MAIPDLVTQRVGVAECSIAIPAGPILRGVMSLPGTVSW